MTSTGSATPSSMVEIPDDNTGKAILLMESFRTGDREMIDRLVDMEGQWWVIGRGYQPMKQMVDTVCAFAGLMEGEPSTVVGTTSEGDRVALESRGNIRLKDGTPYNNDYHFLLKFRDGRVYEGREYLDTALVERVFKDFL